MTTAKHQTTGAIEVGNQLANRTTEQRQTDKKDAKQQQGRPMRLTAGGRRQLGGGWHTTRPALAAGADQRRSRQHQQLSQQTGLPPECSSGHHHDPLGHSCGTELTTHGEHRIGHHDERQQLEAMQRRIKPQIAAQLTDTDRSRQ